MEEWRDIEGHEGYQISSLGRAKSLARIIIRSDGVKQPVKERIMLQALDGVGYLKVGLNRKTKSVHQLVAISFLNHKTDGYKIVVDHIDNNKLNNHTSNLQLISARENCSKDKKRGSSQYVGVCRKKSTKKWQASIQINGKLKHIGYFHSELDASNAYQDTLKGINSKPL